MRACALGLLLVLGLAWSTACVAQSAQASGIGRPLWVLKGGGSYHAADVPVFLGTGVGNPLASPDRRESMADARARQALGHAVQLGLKSLARDYMARHRAVFDNRDTSGANEFSTVVSQRAAAELAASCRVVEHWKDPHTSMVFALARLDSEDLLYASYRNSLAQVLSQRHGSSASAALALADLDRAVGDQKARQLGLFRARDSAPL
jgi:hypothetical protein